MNTFIPVHPPPELGHGLHRKVLKFRIENFLRTLKNASQLTLEVSHQDQSIGAVIAYTPPKLSSGKVALHACMTAFTISLMELTGVLLA
jgi:hypothetical protein